jgi:hypothetical protein
MRFTEVQIEINASPEVVWKHLTDFASYPEWNPLYLWAEGDLKEGNLIRYKAARSPAPFIGLITSPVPNKEFIWEADVPIPGLKPLIIRRLNDLGKGRTQFIFREEFTGWMVPFIKPILDLQIGPYIWEDV